MSAVYVGFGDTTLITTIFAGLGPAVVAIVAQAVHRVGKRALTHPALIGIAIGAFLALALFGVPFPIVIAVAALVGWMLPRRNPTRCATDTVLRTAMARSR